MNNHNLEQSAISQIHEEKNHFNVLPDEILLQIFNKLSDLKTLYFCSLVSHRFALIIPYVDHVSLIVPRQNPNSTQLDNPNPTDNFPKKMLGFLINGVVTKPFKFVRQLVSPKPIPRSISSFYGDSFRSAVSFLSKFKEIKVLDMELPSSCDKLDSDYFDRNFLFKWSAIFGSKIDTFMFLSLCSIQQNEQLNENPEVVAGLGKGIIHLAFQCLKEAIVRQRMLLFFIEQHPLLERVCITDSKKRGMLSLRNEKLVEVRNWIGFNLDTIGSELKCIEVPMSARQWCVPVLELPVSGYMVQGGNSCFNGNGQWWRWWQ